MDEFFIIQQIPRDLANIDQHMETIQNTKSDLYKSMISQQGMRNLVYEIEEIIDQPDSLDIWIVYQSEK